MKKIMTVLLALLLCAVSASAMAETSVLTGKAAMEIVNDMGIGFNIGNTFDATGYDANDIYAQEQSWGNPVVDQALIQRIKDAGFSTIRIPITWYRNLSDDGTYTIDPAFLARIKEVVDYCYACDMYVIINMHHEAWLNVKTLDKDYEQIGVQLAAMWAQIADTFADYDQHLIFEAMNEPRMAGTGVEWNGNKAGYEAVNYLNQVFVDTVRIDPKGNNGERCLMIPGYAASSSYAPMAAIKLPVVNGETAKNLVISVHCYSPYDFCLSDKMKVFDASNKSHTSSIDSVFSNTYKLFVEKGIPVVIGRVGLLHGQQGGFLRHPDHHLGQRQQPDLRRRMPCLGAPRDQQQAPQSAHSHPVSRGGGKPDGGCFLRCVGLRPSAAQACQVHHQRQDHLEQ